MIMLTSTHRALMAEQAQARAWLLGEYNHCNQERLDLQRRYNDLLGRLTDKLIPVPQPKPVPTPPRERDEADTAIEWRAQGDTGVKAYLARYAKAERKKGVDPKVIAQAIMDGERIADDEGVPG